MKVFQYFEKKCEFFQKIFNRKGLKKVEKNKLFENIRGLGQSVFNNKKNEPYKIKIRSVVFFLECAQNRKT